MIAIAAPWNLVYAKKVRTREEQELKRAERVTCVDDVKWAKLKRRKWKEYSTATCRPIGGNHEDIYHTLSTSVGPVCPAAETER